MDYSGKDIKVDPRIEPGKLTAIIIDMIWAQFNN